MFAHKTHVSPAFFKKTGKVYEKIIQKALKSRSVPHFLFEAGIAVRIQVLISVLINAVNQ